MTIYRIVQPGHNPQRPGILAVCMEYTDKYPDRRKDIEEVAIFVMTLRDSKGLIWYVDGDELRQALKTYFGEDE